MTYFKRLKWLVTACVLTIGTLAFSGQAFAYGSSYGIDCDSFPYTGDQALIATTFCKLKNVPLFTEDGNIWGKYRILYHLAKSFHNPEQACNDYEVTKRHRTHTATARLVRAIEIAEDKREIAWWSADKVSLPEVVQLLVELKAKICDEDTVTCGPIAITSGSDTLEVEFSVGNTSISQVCSITDEKALTVIRFFSMQGIDVSACDFNDLRDLANDSICNEPGGL